MLAPVRTSSPSRASVRSATAAVVVAWRRSASLAAKVRSQVERTSRTFSSAVAMSAVTTASSRSFEPIFGASRLRPPFNASHL